MRPSNTVTRTSRSTAVREPVRSGRALGRARRGQPRGADVGGRAPDRRSHPARPVPRPPRVRPRSRSRVARPGRRGRDPRRGVHSARRSRRRARTPSAARRGRDAPHHGVLRGRSGSSRVRAHGRGRGELRRRGSPPVRVDAPSPGCRPGALPRRDHRCRTGRAVRGDPPGAGRYPLHRVREERRRGRNLVREHLSRPPGRRPEPLLLVLLLPQPRLVRLLRPARRAGRLHHPRREGVRRVASRPLPDRGARGGLRRGAEHLVADAPRPRRCGGARRGHRADQRGGNAEPPVDPRDRRARLVRGPVLPLGALGPRGRAPRPAGRGDRHRRQCHAVRARDRARHRATADLPAIATLGDAQPELPPGRDRRREVALRPRAVLRVLVPVPDVLEQCRPHLPGVPCGSDLARSRRVHQPGQRQAPSSHDRSTSSRSSRSDPTWSPRCSRSTRRSGSACCRTTGGSARSYATTSSS